MLKRRNYRNFKPAGITVEVSLAMALGIVVLFLAIGIFSDNLKNMAANAGIQHLFNKDAQAAKTHYDSKNINYNASQVNVQTVADQGLTLDQYVANAQATVNTFPANPTPSQIEDLAKALTVLAVNAGTTSGLPTALRKQYGISITLNAGNGQTGTTTVKSSGKVINYTYSQSNSTDTAKLSVVKDVMGKSFS